MTEIYVVDIKLAAILSAVGVPHRQSDPVTCEVVERNGKETNQYKFWFSVDTPELQALAKETTHAYSQAKNWENFTLDKEHPIYWMKGALENREVYLDWMRRNVEPLKIIQVGSKTVLIGQRASRELREKVKSQL